MSRVQIISSGSKGNAYIFTFQDGVRILLDCGVAPIELQNYKLAGVKACLLTHSHQDHCKGLPYVLKLGIDTYMSPDTYKEIGIKSHRIKICEPNIIFPLGDKKRVKPLKACHHPLKTPLMFYIDDAGERILYATDTTVIPYRLKLHIAILECNYVESIFLNKPGLNPAREMRTLAHNSLESLLIFFQNNKDNITDLEELHLVHLSSENSDEGIIEKEIRKVIPVKTKLYIMGEPKNNNNPDTIMSKALPLFGG